MSQFGCFNITIEYSAGVTDPSEDLDSYDSKKTITIQLSPYITWPKAVEEFIYALRGVGFYIGDATMENVIQAMENRED